MKEIEFQFHRSNHLLGRLIRFFSRGMFNHVSIRMGRYVYESHIHSGVRKVLYSKWNSDSVVHSFLLDVDTDSYDYTKEWLDKQVGKKYDIFGVLSFLWRLFEESEGKWFCSELAMVTLAKARCIEIYNQRQSPQEFFYSLFLTS